MVQYIIEWILYIITKQTLWKDRLWITQLETSCLSRGWVYMALLLTTKFSLKIILCLVHIKNVYQKKGRKFTVCGCFLWILNTDQKFGNTLNLRNLLALPSVMNVMPFWKQNGATTGLRIIHSIDVMKQKSRQVEISKWCTKPLKNLLKLHKKSSVN